MNVDYFQNNCINCSKLHLMDLYKLVFKRPKYFVLSRYILPISHSNGTELNISRGAYKYLDVILFRTMNVRGR